MAAYRAALFDMDGTIIDSFEFHLAYMRRLLQRLGVTISHDDMIPYMGISLQYIFGKLVDPKDHKRGFALGKTVIAEEMDDLKDRLRVVPGALQTVRALRQKGLRVFIVTNSPTFIAERFTAHFHFLEVFEGVYPARNDEVDKRLRCRDLLASMDIPPAEALYVGDSSHDMRLAREVGMHGVLVDAPHAWIHRETDGAQGFADAGSVVGDISELLTLK